MRLYHSNGTVLLEVTSSSWYNFPRGEPMYGYYGPGFSAHTTVSALHEHIVTLKSVYPGAYLTGLLPEPKLTPNAERTDPEELSESRLAA